MFRSRLAALGCFAWCLAASLAASLAAAESPSNDPAADEDGIRFFESRIRPLLAERCYECHGPETQESNLRLDSLAGMLKGGDAAAAIVPGKVEASLLLTAIGYGDADLRMPPDGKLNETQVADLRRWVEMGAPHPEAAGEKPPVVYGRGKEIDWDAARRFWAFQPIAAAPPPPVRAAGWAESEIDQFLLAELETKGLAPAEPADRRTLLRRATFDLTGLPPLPEDIEAFAADASPAAFSRVVDRLLASPAYGERWGRHWLDVARYADSNGLDENIHHGNAWRYRDYVVASLNADKPFDHFAQEQLAGDLLPAAAEERPRDRYERLIATGFLSLGPKVLAEVDERKMEMDIVDEQIDAVGRAFLGLTLGCARCHDHKFDPLTQRDYYALAGVFRSTKTMDSFTKIAVWHEHALPTPEYERLKQEHDGRVRSRQAEIEALVQSETARLAAPRGACGLPETEPVEAAADVAAPAEPPKEEAFSAEVKDKLKALRDEVVALEKAAPQADSAMGVQEGTAADVAVHVRGSHLTLGEISPRRAPQVLAVDWLPQPNITAQGSGRLELAQWLVDARHPLTSRVIVNRAWRWHFGRGLVPSTDNFGELGERPSHPALLDWLAARLVRDDWSLKTLHRRIMLSAAYQMAGNASPPAAQVDPENLLLSHYPLRRLEAEAIRDSLLAVSGQLDPTMGGTLMTVKNREFIFDHTSIDNTKYDSTRRSLYLPVIRNHLYDVFSLFDYSDAATPNGDRPTTTVAPQALFVMNSQFVESAAAGLAERVLALVEPGGAASESKSDALRIARLYQIAYGRTPSESEVARAQQFLSRAMEAWRSQEPDAVKLRQRAWTTLCHALLAANEFVYVR